MPVCPVPARLAATVHYFSIPLISTSIVYPCYVYTLYAETLSHLGGWEVVSGGRGQWFCLFIYWLTTTDCLLSHYKVKDHKPLASAVFWLLADCFSISQLLFSQCVVLCNVCTAYMSGWRCIKMVSLMPVETGGFPLSLLGITPYIDSVGLDPRLKLVCVVLMQQLRSKQGDMWAWWALH